MNNHQVSSIVRDFDWKDKRVLVTGASGFKASWLCEVLLKLGANVYGTVRPRISPLSAYKIFGLEQKIIQVNADTSIRQQVFDMINSVNPDVIFHLAAQAIVPAAKRDPRRTFEVNIMGTVNIIEACRELKVCNRLLIVSTDHVFGNVDQKDLPKQGFKEDSSLNYGGDPYSSSKAAMELVVRSYYATYWNELPSLGITRCANVFGCGDANLRRIVPEFINKAILNKKIDPRYLLTRRQYIHITDAIAGYILAASSLNEGGYEEKKKKAPSASSDKEPLTPTFHFAIENYEHKPYENYLSSFKEAASPGDPFISVGGLAQIISEIYSPASSSTIPVDLGYNPDKLYAPHENKAQALNCETTHKTLGWKTLKSLKDALEEDSQWYLRVRGREAVLNTELLDLRNLMNSSIDNIVRALC
jgi:CDP-glucose 4,6-dehydratase